MNAGLTDFLNVFIEGMIDRGVQQAVISPGSRSTPLALLLTKHPKIKSFVDVDERSAAFFALGLSKASRQPVVCLCTSGTAAANYFPAICEAEESQIPLIILTTDRPHELRNISAPQTMSQQSLYGDKVKLAIELPLPSNEPAMLTYSYAQAFQLVAQAQNVPQGPVHGNFPFREPLLPDLSRATPNVRRKQFYSAVKQLDSERVAQLNQYKFKRTTA